MDDKELRRIVIKAIDDGKSDEEIRGIVSEYRKTQEQPAVFGQPLAEDAGMMEPVSFREEVGIEEPKEVKIAAQITPSELFNVGGDFEDINLMFDEESAARDEERKSKIQEQAQEIIDGNRDEFDIETTTKRDDIAPVVIEKVDEIGYDLERKERELRLKQRKLANFSKFIEPELRKYNEANSLLKFASPEIVAKYYSPERAKRLEANIQKLKELELDLGKDVSQYESLRTQLGDLLSAYKPQYRFDDEVKSVLTDPSTPQAVFEEYVKQTQERTDQEAREGTGITYGGRRAVGLEQLARGIGKDATALAYLFADKLGYDAEGLKSSLQKQIRASELLNAKIPNNLKQATFANYIDVNIDGKNVEIRVDEDGNFISAADLKDKLPVQLTQQQINDFNRSGVGKGAKRKVKGASLAQAGEQTAYDLLIMMLGSKGTSLAARKLTRNIAEDAAEKITNRMVRANVGLTAFGQSLGDNYQQAIKEYGDTDEAKDVALSKSLITGALTTIFPGIESGGLLLKKSVQNSITKAATSKAPVVSKLAGVLKDLSTEVTEEELDVALGNLVDISRGLDKEVLSTEEGLTTLALTLAVSSPVSIMTRYANTNTNNPITNSIVNAAKTPANLAKFIELVNSTEGSKEEKQAKINLVKSLADNFGVLEGLSEEQQNVVGRLIIQRNALEQKMNEKGLVPAAKDKIKKQIEKLDNQIDAIQKQKPDEVPVQPETRVSEEVEEETPEAKPEEPTTETEEEVGVEVIKGDRLATNEPITINYNRNPERAPDMGEQFGQDVEAAGTYVTQKEADFTPEGFETGTIKINNPLVVDVTADTQIEYKRKLSQENEGKTGVELTNALKEKGFDAIVTKNEDGTTGEIVLLNDISTYKVKQPTPTPVAQPDVKIDAEAIKTNVTPESERILGLGLEAEDGATLNIDGTKYEQGGLVVPVASENIKQSELTPERVSEFIEKNRDKIGDTETVKPGLYKFPNQDVVSLDLNIVIPRANREVGLQFGKAAGQESLLDLDTFENVKTGATGDSPMSFTPQQFKEIAVALKENRMPDFLSEEKAPVKKPAPKTKAVKVEPTEEETRLLSDVEQYQIEIEDLQSEIVNEKQNLKDDLAKLNAKIKEVRASKKKKETKEELIEDLKGQKQDLKDDNEGLIDGYKQDIKSLKSDQRKAQRRIKKLQEIRQKKTQEIEEVKKPTEPDSEKEVDAEELADLVRRQAERMTVKIEDGKLRLRLSREGDEKVEPAIDKELLDAINNLYEDGAAQIDFTVNELSEDIEVNPALDSKTLDPDSKEYGKKFVKRIEEFLGIPSLVTAYDILGTGTAKDSQGNDMRISGGVNFALGKTNRGLASANTTEEYARKEFKAAKDLYRNNKELFDRLWKEGRLPKGHVPVAILRMADTGMNSNEAVFRFLLPTIKKLPLENRQNAYNLFKEEVLNKKNEKGNFSYSKEVRSFFSKNKEITTLDQLFEKIIEDAGKRKEARTPKEAKTLSELPIDKRKEIAEKLIGKTLLSEGGKKTALKEPIKELFKGQELGKDSDNFYFDTIYNAIGEESMLKTQPYSVVGLAGIDVLSINSGPKKVDHENYGFGNKGQIIALFSNPKLGVDVFPEFFAKASRVAVENKEGVFPKISSVIQRIQGMFPSDKIFKGAVISLGKRTEAQEIAAFMRQAFPTLTISNTQEEFDNLANQAKARLVKSSDNVTILGIANGNKIFLNPSKASLETPIHEFGHVWVDYLRSTPNGKKLLQKGFDLIDGTVAFDNASRKYGEFDADGKLTNKELVLEEALVEAIATKGGVIANTTKESKFRTWLKAMFDYIKKTFKGTIEYIDVNGKEKKVDRINERLAEKLSLDDFLNMALADLFSGKELKPRFKPGGTEVELRFRIDETDGEGNKNVFDIVYEARQDGFSDNVIRAYLKKQGYSVKEIDSAMSFQVDLFQTMPAAFGNVEGGVSVGIKIYNRVSEKLSNLKKRKKSLGFGELRSKAIEFLKNDPDFKKQSEDVQMLMVVDYDKSLNTRANKIVNNEIKEIKTKIRKRKIGAKNIAKVKTDLRVYIRKNLPKTTFNKKFVTDLLKKVTDATVDTMPFIVSEVDSMINEVKSKDFQKRIDKLLKTKSATVQSGRLKGKISTEAQDSINAINENINVDKENTSAIETRLQALRDELDTISSETAMSEEQLNRAQILDISINYLNSFLMEDSDFSKVETLQSVEDSINALVTEGISDFKAQMAVQSRYYKSIIGKFLGQVVGKQVDMDNPDELRELSNRSDKKITERNQKNAKNMFRRLGEGIRSQFLRTEAMEGLIDVVTRAAGDMFGGVAQQLTTDKVDDSSSVYKARMIEVFEKTLKPNATRIFGKNYTEQMRKNAVPKKVNVYTNPKRVSEIDALLKKETDPAKRNELLREKEDLSMVMSQNQMYYLYNQYKDPANHPGFKTMYGEQHPEVMRQMTEALDAKVKQWADWQVEELYPALYPYYNAVYKKVYRTDMPWNQYYAGMLYRDGDNPETVVSMLSDKGGFATYVGGKSTKMRIKNKKGIKTMDGDSVLVNYVKDMEHFAAYAENVRDISKILKNQYVRKSMEANDGKTVLNLLDTMLEDIASRGLRKKADSLMVNSLTDMFVISKLGLNPTVAIKQMTSALAFADYIGYRNWVSYGAKAFTNPAKVWKEMTQLSPLLQDRYKYSDIKRVMESYNETRSNGVLGATNKDKVVNAMMYLIKVGDMMGVAGSMSNYLFYIDKFKKEFPNLSEQQVKMKAMSLVEKQIKRTQQSQDIQDKDSWQRGNEFARAFSIFLSSTKALFRKEIQSSRNLYRKAISLDPKAGKGTVKENLRTFMTYHMALPVLVQFVALGFPGLLAEWEEEDLEELAWAALLGNINSVFAIGDALQTIRELATNKPWAGDAKSVSAITIPTQLITSIGELNKAIDEGDPEKINKNFHRFMNNMPFIPYQNVKKMYDNFTTLNTGEDRAMQKNLLRLMNYNQYVIEGQKKR